MGTVRSHIKLTWTTDKLGAVEGKNKKDILQAIVDGMSQAQEAKKKGMGSFIFFYSHNHDKKKAKVRKAATDSKVVREKFIEGDGDFSIPVVARFFHCIIVDVSNVTPKDNPEINNETAPYILVVNKDGEVEEDLSSKSKCSISKISSALGKVMKKDGLKEIASKQKALAKAMLDYMKTEYMINVNTSKIKKFKAYIAKEEAKDPKFKIPSSTKKTIKKAEKDLEKDREKRYKILKEEYDLLKEAGLADSQLPQEPQPPAEA